MQVPEHTWGLDTKQAPNDYTNWSNEALQHRLAAKDKRFENAIAQWERQRGYMAGALEAWRELPGVRYPLPMNVPWA